MKIGYLVLGTICLAAVSCNSDGGNSRSGPEKATQTYVSMIAKADYDKALDVSTSSAAETIIQMKEMDTKGYETKIIEIKCEKDIEAKTAKCKCTERRIDSTATLNYKYDSFVYELEELDGVWKVNSQTKDMPNIGDTDFEGADMLNEAPVEPTIIEESLSVEPTIIEESLSVEPKIIEESLSE